MEGGIVVTAPPDWRLTETGQLLLVLRQCLPSRMCTCQATHWAAGQALSTGGPHWNLPSRERPYCKALKGRRRRGQVGQSPPPWPQLDPSLDEQLQFMNTRHFHRDIFVKPILLTHSATV